MADDLLMCDSAVLSGCFFISPASSLVHVSVAWLTLPPLHPGVGASVCHAVQENDNDFEFIHTIRFASGLCTVGKNTAFVPGEALFFCKCISHVVPMFDQWRIAFAGLLNRPSRSSLERGERQRRTLEVRRNMFLVVPLVDPAHWLAQ